MKTLTSFGIGAVLLGAVSSASAYIPNSNTDADVVLTHGGASASSQSVLRTVKRMCSAGGSNHVFYSEYASRGTPDITNFLDNGNRTDGDYFTIACEVDAGGTADVPIGTALTGNATGTGGRYRVLYYKRDVGGSAMGVQPLATNANVGFMSPVTANCTPVGANAVHYDCDNSINQAAGNAYVAVSTHGTSDVEPVIFTAGENNTANDIDWDLNGASDNPLPTDGQVAALPTEVTAYLTFGVPANYRMYTALQYAQFPTGHPDFDDCNPTGANYGNLANDGDNAASEKCMPNLSTQQVNSLFVSERAIDTLKELQAPTEFNGDTLQSVWDAIPANGATYSQDTFDGGAGFGAADESTVVICRRTEGSGTGAQHMLFYHNYPCDRDAADLVVSTNLPQREAAFGFNGVIENTGSGKLSDCLLAYDNGTNSDANANPNLYDLPALGLQSAVRTEDDDHNWRYIKIDGHAPSLKNVHAGKYEQVYAQTWQTSTLTEGNALSIVDALILASQQPEFQDGLNNTNTFGRAGWLANSGTDNCGPDCVANVTLNEGLPVYPYVRESDGGDVNACSTPRVTKGVGGNGPTGGIHIGDN